MTKSWLTKAKGWSCYFYESSRTKYAYVMLWVGDRKEINRPRSHINERDPKDMKVWFRKYLKNWKLLPISKRCTFSFVIFNPCQQNLNNNKGYVQCFHHRPYEKVASESFLLTVSKPRCMLILISFLLPIVPKARQFYPLCWPSMAVNHEG